MEYKSSNSGDNKNQYDQMNSSSKKNLSNEAEYISNSTIEDINPQLKDKVPGPEQPEAKKGVMERMVDYFKNINWPWTIEEEEFIDAHGFKCKRPKHPIPLRKKAKYEDDIKNVGDGMTLATHNSGFGNAFL